MLENRKGISEIIGYVLLIVIALSLSLLVYSWLKGYIPGNPEKCPGNAGIMINDYSCNSAEKKITLDLKNSGLFNLYGFIVRVRSEENGFWFELKDRGEVENYFVSSLIPNEIERKVFSFSQSKIVEIQIQPFILGDKGEVVLCDNAIMTQKIDSCEASTSGGNGGNIPLDSSKVEADISLNQNPPNQGPLGFQMRWDISSIPTGKTIDNAKLCLYISNKVEDSDFDLDARISRLTDETWNENIVNDDSQLQTLTTTDITTSYLWTSEDIGTYTCIDVTEQLLKVYGNSNYLSLRLTDPDAPFLAINSLTSANAGDYFFGGVRPLVLDSFISLNSKEALSNQPYLDVTYH